MYHSPAKYTRVPNNGRVRLGRNRKLENILEILQFGVVGLNGGGGLGAVSSTHV